MRTERVDGRRVRVTNRRFFTGTDDLQLRWTLEVDGRRVARGTTDVDVGPGRSTPVTLPLPRDRRDGEAHLLVEFVQRRGTPWAPRGHVVAWDQFAVGGESKRVRGGRRPIEVDTTPAGIAGVRIDDIVVIDGDIAPWLWRAPTDNDGVQQGWMSEVKGPRLGWVRWGLDDLELLTDSVGRRRRGEAEVITIERRIVGSAEEARHRTTVTIEDGVARFDERIDLPSRWRDLPRVGVRFEVPSSFDQLEWFGLGPDETYPDRRSSATVRRWRSTVDEQHHPYVVPQEHAAHVETRWMTLTRRGGSGLHVSGARPLTMTARSHHDRALTAAATLADLTPGSTTEVHIDAAVRGLGTDACGPDTLPEFRVRAGTHRWTWYLGSPR